MSLTSKSPQDVAREALAAGTAALTPYSHKFSPKTFSQPQLFACLVLRKFYKTDYRGIAAQLRDHAELRQILGLKKVPHFTTLQKAARRLLARQEFRALLRFTIRRVFKRRRSVRRAAMDSSGFACGYASRYYVRRRAKGQSAKESPSQQAFYRRYAKLETVFDTRTHLAIGVLTSRGPAPDVDRLMPLLSEADLQVKIKSLVADAGYDSEMNHVFARLGCRIRSLMPPKHGRPSDKPPKGRWRRQMRDTLSTTTKRRRSGYSQRAQAETGFSMIKRRQGEFVAARTFANQCGELRLMVLTHNLMIAYVRWGFLQSRSGVVLSAAGDRKCIDRRATRRAPACPPPSVPTTAAAWKASSAT
jgi:transposase